MIHTRSRFGTILIVFSLVGDGGSSQPRVLAARKTECEVLRTTDGTFVYREVRLCNKEASVAELKEVCHERLPALSIRRPERFVDVFVSNSLKELERSVLNRVVPSRDYGAGFDRTIEALREFGTNPAQLEAPLIRCSSREGFSRITVANAGGDRVEMREVPSTITSTEDPQRLRVGSQELDVIWIEEKFGSTLPYHSVHFSALAKTKVDCEVCKEALRRFTLKRRTGLTSAVLRIRTNPWFDGDSFPLIYRFNRGSKSQAIPGPLLGVPTVEDYYSRSAETYCMLSGASEGETCVYKGAWIEEEDSRTSVRR